MTTSLIYDRRTALGQRPGTHALLIGVSEYPNLPPDGERLGVGPPHFGLTRLGSPAISADLVRRWLETHADDLPAPLATVRVLALPSAAEPGLEAGEAPTLAAVQRAAADWREDAARDPEGATIFFFSGHGVQVDRLEQVLLLADFGDGLGSPLQAGVNVSSLVNGMAPTPGRPRIARRQLFFFDACRTPLALMGEDERTSSLALSVQTPAADDRRVVRYYAAAPGTQAFGVAGEPSLYAGALLRCLDGAASDRAASGWVVSAASLAEGLDVLLREAAAREGGEQRCWSEGNLASGDMLILPLAGAPPETELELSITPGEYSEHVRVHLRTVLGGVVHDLPEPLRPLPYACRLPPDFYLIGADGRPPARGLPDDVLVVKGPRMRRELKVR